MINKIFFKNRTEAGKDLAKKLAYLKDKEVVVFGLPRGGIPVAYEVARSLNAKLEALPVRKISMPERKEVAIGAMSFDGTIVLNERYIELLNIGAESINEQTKKEKLRLDEMMHKFRKNIQIENLKGKIAIVVDDGIATGYTTKVALETLRKYNPKELILATPVIDEDIYYQLLEFTDSIVGNVVNNLQAISMFYEDFSQTEDDEVLKLLHL
jgi:putative phosphoribosyl transferase